MAQRFAEWEWRLLSRSATGLEVGHLATNPLVPWGRPPLSAKSLPASPTDALRSPTHESNSQQTVGENNNSSAIPSRSDLCPEGATRFYRR